ncbi:unnamed protein product [Rotaria sp. Silwood1]|nr:unnamed protein product [Rotaria sp. Silwood1]CAF1066248.1 unnamed protein product [Rotaria sp. Silwood1]
MGAHISSLIKEKHLDVYVSSHIPKSSNPSTHDASSKPALQPLLLWMDSPENVRKETDEIKKRHPTLEIIFKSTYKDAEEYLQQNSRDTEEREKFITICRGYFVQEKKGFTHVAQLFENLHLGTKPLAVYTRNTNDLLKRTPDPPRNVAIFDKQNLLFDFIKSHLQ